MPGAVENGKVLRTPTLAAAVEVRVLQVLTLNIYLECKFRIEFQLNALWKNHFSQTKSLDFWRRPRNFEEVEVSGADAIE